LNTLDKQIISWKQSIKNQLTTEHSLATALENVYILDRSNCYSDAQRLLTEYRISKQVCLDSTFKILDNNTKSISRIIHRGLELCIPVSKIIRKRNDKQLDYERLLSIKGKGEIPDPLLLESGDEYLAINALVIEEIPKFIDYIGELVGVVMDGLLSIQKEFCTGYHKACQNVGAAFFVEGFGGFERIPNDYYAAMAPGRNAEISCREIGLLSKWKDSVWGSGKFSSSVPAGVSRTSSFASLPRSRDVSLIDFSATTRINYPNLVSPPLQGQGHGRSLSLGMDNSRSPSRNTYKPIPILVHFAARCLYNFKAETADELNMEIGDLIDVDTTFDRGAEGWWFGTSERGTGWIPSNFVERL
jgi:hypothetical protein